MSHPEALSQWTQVVSKQIPHLSKPQATVLEMYSFATVVVQSCGRSRVATFLAALLEKKESNLRQQLREFCYEAHDKRGAQRQAVDVQLCFATLLGWVLSWWSAEEQRLALALDASTLGQRFTVLCISAEWRPVHSEVHTALCRTNWVGYPVTQS